MSVSAIIPVWNGRELLERLLDTLDAQTQPVGELLVVDNGSTDGAPELARRRGARVLAMGRNAGFAPAVNRGIAESRGDWIAVLNSDVELAPDYLEALADTGAWFATGRILKAGAPHRIDAAFDAVCRGATAWRVGNGRNDGPAFASARAIWSAPWTAALFRRELFGRVGVLEESFESYLEDVDFGLRCARLNLAGQYVPGAVAWHRGSAALGRWHPDTVRHIARNQLLLAARHYPRACLLRWSWPILVAQLLWGGVAIRHGAGGAWAHGIWQGIRNFAALRRKSTVCDPELLRRILREHERAIWQIQSSTGFDLYWRLYFLLTGGGAR
ncbi:MAG: glycosyltransferase family 2 protein [Bryobacteraceae bacterium]